MTIDRRVFRGGGRGVVPPACAGITIGPACPRGDAAAIADLVAACRGDGFPVPSVRGLAAELESRPGRTVRAWLARAGASPVGIVTLVAAGGDGGVRHSIAWLVVAPAWRRRGVATALVATAVADALGGGPVDVWVEARSDWRPAASFWDAVGFTVP